MVETASSTSSLPTEATAREEEEEEIEPRKRVEGRVVARPIESSSKAITFIVNLVVSISVYINQFNVDQCYFYDTTEQQRKSEKYP